MHWLAMLLLGLTGFAAILGLVWLIEWSTGRKP